METETFYRITADALVVFHSLFVGFVVFGLLLILLGAARRWQWVRNPWFRVIHLATISVVAMEAVFGVECPLTVWENDLRKLGGGETYERSFLGQLAHSLLYYDIPQWVFRILHTVFGLAVLATFVLVPPRWRRRRESAAGGR